MDWSIQNFKWLYLAVRKLNTNIWDTLVKISSLGNLKDFNVLNIQQKKKGLLAVLAGNTKAADFKSCNLLTLCTYQGTDLSDQAIPKCCRVHGQLLNFSLPLPVWCRFLPLWWHQIMAITVDLLGESSKDLSYSIEISHATLATYPRPWLPKTCPEMQDQW